ADRSRTSLEDRENAETAWPWQMTSFQKLIFSVEDMVDALVNTNIIGKGCYGMVYKAQMSNGTVVAVKRLWTCKRRRCDEMGKFRNKISKNDNNLIEYQL
ncbi:hypothetical protein KI387_020680, partial [Taxus chinensis]